MRHPTRLIVMACVLLSQSGCVVGRIHDEMVSTNGTLTEVQQELELVREVNTLLAASNERLEAVETRLALMDSIDASLVSIDGSLRKLDAHLASLRGTIKSIDSAIPLLKFSSDEETAAVDEGDASPRP